MPVENTPKEKEEGESVEKEAAKKMFPFMIRKFKLTSLEKESNIVIKPLPMRTRIGD